MKFNWIEQFKAAITICDNDGIIVEMNDKAAELFREDGGYDLIGKNLFDCHSQQSTQQIKSMIKEQESNVYTIEKDGIKKMIYQAPWIQNNEMKGLVEISFEIPFELPHHKR